MLALTLHPEWAWAVAHLGKRIENRGWQRAGLRGQTIAIHGGKSIGGDSDKTLWPTNIRLMLAQARKAGADLDAVAGVVSINRILNEGRGIVALARVARFVESSESGWFVGPIGWVLEDVRVLRQPVCCKGAQGLWTVPLDVAIEVAEVLRAG